MQVICGCTYGHDRICVAIRTYGVYLHGYVDLSESPWLYVPAAYRHFFMVYDPTEMRAYVDAEASTDAWGMLLPAFYFEQDSWPWRVRRSERGATSAMAYAIVYAITYAVVFAISYAIVCAIAYAIDYPITYATLYAAATQCPVLRPGTGLPDSSHRDTMSGTEIAYGAAVLRDVRY
eukprot:3732073-Rhodomonas_salina.4